MHPLHPLLRPSDDPHLWEAVLPDGQGRPVRHGPAALKDLALHLTGRECAVLVPGERVLLTRAQLPTRNPRAIRRALPYALEEQLAQDVEDLHFVPGARQADGALPVAVVARVDMDAWTQALRAAHLQVRAMVPETALLPAPESGWGLWLEGESAWLAMGEGAGMALDREQAAFWVRRQWQQTPEAERPERITLHRIDDPREADQALQGLADQPGLELHWQEDAPGLMETLAARWPARPPLDLLTGPYDLRRGRGGGWRPWRAAAGLLLAVVLVQLASQLWVLQALEGERARLEGEIRQVYGEAFPGGRIVDPRRQMESALRQLEQGDGGARGDGLAALLGRAGPVLAGADGLSLRSLRYQPGRLDLDLDLADLQTLDRLKARLEAESDRPVVIRSASAREDRVEARILIGGAG
ncbi:type II secretion system protein GspL [Ectothiorhodospira mobilis]|uniref:type II secretion system protein GspL n=1 Tax=Ectothiorhodospira mobilis TaxID=195064 RepID=UPI002379CB03|nr:type II secretion system protein GspL [Ectothiorhodospira mobilis]